MAEEKRKQHGWYTDKKKLEVVTAYLILGKSNLVAATCGVPEGTVRAWKTEPWWDEIVDSIQAENDQELDAKLSARVEKALDIVQDRLDNGDFMFNPRTGEFVRRPVSLRDTWKVNKEMIDARLLLRKSQKETVSAEATADILKNLALEFAGMARKRMKDGTVESEQASESVGTQLQEGVRQLPREAGADSESLPTELCEAGVRESER